MESIKILGECALVYRLSWDSLHDGDPAFGSDLLRDAILALPKHANQKKVMRAAEALTDHVPVSSLKMPSRASGTRWIEFATDIDFHDNLHLGYIGAEALEKLGLTEFMQTREGWRARRVIGTGSSRRYRLLKAAEDTADWIERWEGEEHEPLGDEGINELRALRDRLRTACGAVVNATDEALCEIDEEDGK